MGKKSSKSKNAHILSRGIRVVVIDENKESKKKAYEYIKFCAKQLCQVANECSNEIYMYLQKIKKNIEEHNVSKSQAFRMLKEEFGKPYDTLIYQVTRNYKLLSGNMRGIIAFKLSQTYNEKFYRIVNVLESMPSFTKSSLPIPMAMKNSPLYQEGDDIYVNFITSRHSDVPNIKLKLLFGRDRSGNKIIAQKIISGELIQSDSELKVDDYGELTYNMKWVAKKKVDETLDPNIIMGVDIGINYPVAIYIEGVKHQPRQIAAGAKIQHERMAISRRRQSIIRSLKYNRGGHGRKRKLAPKILLSSKEKNFAKNMNDQMSRELVNIALENKCGVIKLERLKGITKNTKEYFLKSWSYYQLQHMITYKAELEGIQVKFVDPAYTSQMCPTCKEIDEKNRDEKDRTKFKCVNFLCEDHDKEKIADIIAARNIANKKPIAEKTLKLLEMES